jgi:GNAT superfamily N-acetyltransferase
VHIRPFNTTAHDYAAVARLLSEVHPERPISAAIVRRWDADRDQDYEYQRFVVEQSQRIVAAGLVSEVGLGSRSGKFLVTMGVTPSHRGRGIGRALFRRLARQLQSRRATSLVCAAQEDCAAALHMVKQHGFRQEMRVPASRLGVRDFDPTVHQPTLAEVRNAGIEILDLEQLQARFPNWKRRLWDLDWEIHQDVPYPEPPTRVPYDQFVKAFEWPTLLPSCWYCALHADDWVGMSFLHRDDIQDRHLLTGLTGVRRSYRRQGIATALKVCSIEAAKRRETEYIHTENEENNPMFSLNLRLGFQVRPARLLFRKEL